MRIPFFRRHPFGEEELSAHVDGRLSPAESARLERHLASCEACRRQLEELRAVVEGLRTLPSVLAPRSFALRPDQVEAEQRQRPAAPVAGKHWPLAFGPAGAAVASLLLLAVLLGVDLSTIGGGGGGFEAEETRQLDGGAAPEAQMPSLGAAPALTPAPAPASRAAAGDEKTGAESYNAETPAPAEEAPLTQETATEEGADRGRWVLRGFEGVAGVAFVVAAAAVVWQRRRRAEQG